MLEKQIENKLTRMVKQHGGIAVKFVLLPDGIIAFVELKALGKKPRPLQIARHKLLRSLGFQVYVTDGVEQIGGMLHELLTP